jgi:thiol-disulfide isomerase/thioredoxin
MSAEASVPAHAAGPRRWLLGSLAAAIVVLGVALVLRHDARRPEPAVSSAAWRQGAFTTLEGRTETLAAFRGTPVLVWFVADGCASCEASIPAVASHLADFSKAGVRILTVGLPASFDPGARGLRELAQFATAATGMPVPQPGWTWGIASLALTIAFDPTGTPDAYVLLGRHGQVRYRGSVPIETLPELLAHVRALSSPTERAVPA